MFVYQFYDPDLEVEIFFKKKGKQKMQALILKQGIEKSLHICSGAEGNLNREPAFFIALFGDKK